MPNTYLNFYFLKRLNPHSKKQKKKIQNNLQTNKLSIIKCVTLEYFFFFFVIKSHNENVKFSY